jgi:hypothetical protein
MHIRGSRRFSGVDGDERKEILMRLQEFLRTTMDSTDADIYVLGLEKGSVTSSDVVKNVKGIKNPTTAKEHLDRLTRGGFFEQTAGEAEGGVGKKGKPIVFRPLPPSLALRQSLAAAEDIIRDMGRLDELLEIGIEPKDEDEVWIIKEEDAALGRLGNAVQQASSEILANCRDGSWWEDNVIRKSMVEAVARGVTVRVAARELDPTRRREMADVGIEVSASAIPMAPFFIVDRGTVFLPHCTGRLATRYGAIRLGNRYLVQHLVDFVLHALEGGSERDV